MSRIYAIIPAAGRSRRMGSPKQLLPYAGGTLLEAVLAPLRQPCVGGIMLVTHHGLEAALAPMFSGTGVRLAFNDDGESGMIDSIRIGLHAWNQAGAAPGSQGPAMGFLIVPSDQPGIPPEAIAACCAAFTTQPDRVVIATHAGRRGHPLIFPASLAPFVHSAACDHGLTALLRIHEAAILAVESPSPAVLRNVNTPDDYIRLQQE